MEDHPPRTSAGRKRLRERFVAHVGLLLVVLCAILGTGVYLGTRVIGALPDVGKDLHPADAWGAPIAVERKANGWLVAYVPPCAQGPVPGLALWDDQNRPMWELRGEAFPINEFLVGAVPAGLKVVHKLVAPVRDQQLRLGVFRLAGRPAGVTFRVRDLRPDTVRYGGKWLSVSEFNATASCPKAAPVKRSTDSSQPAG